ncbi:MAG: hypothetical protein K5854_05735 [Prevotella sp.]|jgi:biopolymer transport protein ExbD|nr:hypothetical protein [Prevotella sp.]
MSNNNKLHRAQREAKQEKQANNVVKWIFISLVILAIIFMIYSMTLV